MILCKKQYREQILGQAVHADAGWQNERRRPEETALIRWFRNTSRGSWPQSKRKRGQAYSSLSQISSTPFSKAAYSRTAFEAALWPGEAGGLLCKRRSVCSCRARRMSETAAHLLDHVILRGRCTRVLSFPILLLILFAAHPEPLLLVLHIIRRIIRPLSDPAAGLKGCNAHGGAVTLILRFGSTANTNIHLHCLVSMGSIVAARACR
jgi:hypothetical protein